MSNSTRLLNHPPTGDLRGWSYEYAWRYELQGVKATVFETQKVFIEEDNFAIGEREYPIFESTENNAQLYIRMKDEALGSGGFSARLRLGCPAACKSRWKWIDASIARKIELVSKVKKLIDPEIYNSPFKYI